MHLDMCLSRAGLLCYTTASALVEKCIWEMLGLDMPEHISLGMMGKGVTNATGGTSFTHHYVLLQVFRGLHNS